MTDVKLLIAEAERRACWTENAFYTRVAEVLRRNAKEPAAARLEALEAALLAADELAVLAEKSRPMTTRAFGAGVEEREGGSARRQGQLIEQYEGWLRSTDVALAAFRARRATGSGT